MNPGSGSEHVLAPTHTLRRGDTTALAFAPVNKSEPQAFIPSSQIRKWLQLEPGHFGVEKVEKRFICLVLQSYPWLRRIPGPWSVRTLPSSENPPPWVPPFSVPHVPNFPTPLWPVTDSQGRSRSGTTEAAHPALTFRMSSTTSVCTSPCTGSPLT